MKPNGKLILLAYPDTFVKVSTEPICKVLPYIGIGTKDYIKAGHAAMVLISDKTEMAYYYDFGRYVTPYGKGRVRSALTDRELEIPFRAVFDKNSSLLNLDDFLFWLDANPHKTHGDGRLVASVCEDINFEAAQHYIINLQKQGSIPYGAFVANGSNCSRFVTDTILAATNNKSILLRLSINKQFTPSPLGNVQKAATISQIFTVYKQQLTVYNKSVFIENLTNYFKRKPKSVSRDSAKKAPLPVAAQYLHGIGSGAYFLLENLKERYHYRIRRFDDAGNCDCDGVFEVNDADFNAKQLFYFIHDSNCKYCHIQQEGYIFRFDFVKDYKESKQINLLQKEHLV